MTLWRKSLGYAVGRGVSSAIAFLLLPVLTRLLTAEQYGTWQVLEFWAVMVMFFIRLGLDQAIFRFYVLEKNKRGRCLFSAFSTMLVTSAFFIVVGFFFRAPLTKMFLGSEFSPNFAALAIIWGVSDAFFSTAAAVFQAEERVSLFILMDIARATLGYGFSVLLLVLGFGVPGVIGSWIGAGFAVIIMVLPVIIRRMKFSTDTKLVSSMVKYGLPLAVNLFVVRIFSFSDRWIIAKLIDFSATGAYSAGVKIASIVVVAIMPIRYAWSARLFHMYKQGTLKSELPAIWRQLSGGIGIIAVGLILLSPEIFKLLIGPGYEIGAKVVPILAAAYFMDALILIADAGIYVKGKTILVPVFTAIAAVINIGFNIILIPKYGAVGAAVAAIFGFTALLFLSWRTGQFFYPIKIPYDKIFIAFLAIGLSIWFVNSFPQVIFRIMVMLILFAALFFGTGLDRDFRNLHLSKSKKNENNNEKGNLHNNS